VLVTNGSSEAIFVFYNDLLDPGDLVILPFPAFQCLYQVSIALGCEVQRLDLLACPEWRLDLDRLADQVTDRTKMIVVNNPHNPFGWTLTVDELTAIGQIAARHGCYLFFDEHYRYLPLQQGTELIPSGYDVCSPIHERTFASGSMIKCFGIVGIRVGWLLGDPAQLARCRDYKDYLTHTTPGITDRLATMALRHKDRLIKASKDNVLPNHDALRRFMQRNERAFSYVEPTGGVVCFPRLELPMGTRAFCEGLAAAHGVSLLPGFAFEAERHLRINFGVQADAFAAALELLQDYVDAHS
jgi:aspartate/methionine/tyrosine aminotransferase